jgi:hypothetical protein
MSHSIWTQCAATFRPRKLEFEAWRVVESQHVVSTRKLVDSDEEQALLEELVDRVKPPLPSGTDFEGLHYLLFTSFRHAPLRHGSRFGTRAERGIWYGAKELETCFAEVSYYRILFLEGSSASLGSISVELTAFTAAIRARKAADLTRPPFLAYRAAISSKTSYEASQALGADMRAAGIEAFVFASARVLEGGTCVGLFSPSFASKRPRRLKTWTCTADCDKVEFAEKSLAKRDVQRLRYARGQFEVAGKLPSPAT